MAAAIDNERITVFPRMYEEKIKKLEVALGLGGDGVDETQSAPVDASASGGEDHPEAQNTPAKTNTPDVKSATEAHDAPEKDSKEKKPGRKKRETKNETKTEKKGISSKSPIVRLLDEEKTLLKRLEAHILLETGETVTDHQLVMDAVREYVKKHYPHFQ